MAVHDDAWGWWKLEELSSTRADETANNRDLSDQKEVLGWSGNRVLSGPGYTDIAAKSSRDDSLATYNCQLEILNQDFNGSNGFTVVGRVLIQRATGQVVDSPFSTLAIWLQDLVDYLFSFSLSISVPHYASALRIATDVQSNDYTEEAYATLADAGTIEEWHFFSMKYDPSIHTTTLKMDDATIWSDDTELNVPAVTGNIEVRAIFSGRGDNISATENASSSSLDDFAIWERALTDAEETELFSGSTPIPPIEIGQQFIINAMLVAQYMGADSEGCIARPSGCKPISELMLVSGPKSILSKDEMPSNLLERATVPLSTLECLIRQ